MINIIKRQAALSVIKQLPAARILAVRAGYKSYHLSTKMSLVKHPDTLSLAHRRHSPAEAVKRQSLELPGGGSEAASTASSKKERSCEWCVRLGEARLHF